MSKQNRKYLQTLPIPIINHYQSFVLDDGDHPPIVFHCLSCTQGWRGLARIPAILRKRWATYTNLHFFCRAMVFIIILSLISSSSSSLLLLIVVLLVGVVGEGGRGGATAAGGSKVTQFCDQMSTDYFLLHVVRKPSASLLICMYVSMYYFKSDPVLLEGMFVFF